MVEKKWWQTIPMQKSFEWNFQETFLTLQNRANRIRYRKTACLPAMHFKSQHLLYELFEPNCPCVKKKPRYILFPSLKYILRLNTGNLTWTSLTHWLHHPYKGDLVIWACAIEAWKLWIFLHTMESPIPFPSPPVWIQSVQVGNKIFKVKEKLLMNLNLK